MFVLLKLVAVIYEVEVMGSKNFEEIRKGLNNISRRDFMKFCTVMAASMGLPLEMAPKLAEALTNPKRPPVIWLSG